MNAAKEALRLHDAGLSVFPVPYGYKTHADYLADNGLNPRHAFKHGIFQLRARLDARAIGKAFEGRSNIAVALKGNLAVLDCETHAAAAFIRAELTARAIPVYGWHTARGAHFLLRIRGAVEVHRTPAYSGQNSPSKHMDNIEVRGTGGYVIAAGSLHPEGVFYRWFDDCADSVPTIDAGALNFLAAHDGTPFTLNLTIRGTGKAQAYKEGGRIPEGGRNNTLFTAAMSLRGQGVSLNNALKQLVPAAVNRDGLSEREARATIKSVYKRESTQSGQRSQRADSDAIEALMAFAQGHDWKAHGRAYRTDKAVFEALIQRARMTDSAIHDKHGIRASTREIAGMVKVSFKAAANALHRLIERGLIERAQAGRDNPDNSTSACAYRFSDTVTKVHRVTAFSTPYGCSVYFSDTHALHPDMLEAIALGRVGAAIYAALAEHATQSDTGMTAREIAAHVGAHRQTVYRLLADDAKLITRGFVECIAHDTPRRYVAHILTPTEQLERIPEGQQAARARRKQHDEARVRYLEHRVRSWREYFDRVNLLAVDEAQHIEPARASLLDTVTVYTSAGLQPVEHIEPVRAQGALSAAPLVPAQGEPLLVLGVSLGASVRPVDEGEPAHPELSEFSESAQADESWGALWSRFSRAWSNTSGRIGQASSTARKHKVAFDAQALRGQLAHAQDLINTDSAAAFVIVDEVNAALDTFTAALKAAQRDGRKAQAKQPTKPVPMFDDEGVNHVTRA